MTQTNTQERPGTSQTGAARRLAKRAAPGILIAALALTAGAVAVNSGRGQLPVGGQPQQEAAVELHKKVALSTAWVITPRGYGTAWLVDAKQGYVVTARHVVAGLKEADLIFAQCKRNGDIITDRAHYERNKATLAVRATVVYQDVRRDMAVLKVHGLLPGIPALSLAARAPRPGQEIHVIGNSSVRHGGLFGYSRGTVRNVFRFDPAGNPILAEVVAHHAPTNQGDSGGPVVNNQGEVVAFISEGTTGGLSGRKAGELFQRLKQPGAELPAPSWTDNQQVLDHSICVTEIRLGLQAVNGKLAAR
jgi:S1-C subfamily serine protease